MDFILRKFLDGSPLPPLTRGEKVDLKQQQNGGISLRKVNLTKLRTFLGLNNGSQKELLAQPAATGFSTGASSS